MSNLLLDDLAPGISAVRGGVCNRGIITAQGQVLVIDAGISAAEGASIRQIADGVHQSSSLALFNTHPHGDHVFGNQAFADQVIIAHEGVRTNLAESGMQMLTSWRQDPGLAPLLDDITLTLPTVTFGDQLTTFVDNIEVRFMHMGAAHSPSDSVAWLPQTRILFAGDILFNGLVPMLPPGSNSLTWVRALEQLEALDVVQVVSGHGPAEPPSALAALRHWLLKLRDEVQQRRQAGVTLEALLPDVQGVMEGYDDRQARERLPMAIRQVYADITQEQG